MTYVAYSPALEKPEDGEAKLFADIAETFRKMSEQVRANEGDAKRGSHAKSTALLKGELIIDAGLPPELAQGVCASPGRHEALVRFAQGPGETLKDEISTHRGLAVKVLGVDGGHIPESPSGENQDWLFEAGETAFINANAKDFLLNLKAGVAHAPRLPEGVKGVVSDVAEAANAALKAVGGGSKMLGFFGHPSHHPLSDAYFSQAPLRWGSYVAKIALVPTQATLDSLSSIEIKPDGDADAFRHAMMAHFESAGAEFELRVQLATNTDDMPIENASKRWSEDDSPYRRVGLLVLPPQSAWTESRSAYVDERVSFQPARSLEAHRPLGQVMRARLSVYQKLADFRRESDAVSSAEPRTLADVPD